MEGCGLSEIKWNENQPKGYGEIQEVVQVCENSEGACTFPFCETDLNCEHKNTVEETAPVTDGLRETKPVNNVEAFFTCQEKLNTLEKEKNRLLQEKNEVFKKVKTDIETVFIALDCEEIGTKITLTGKGLTISYPLRVYNKYQTTLINTDLFTQLNKVMGMKGKLSMSDETKLGGNMVRLMELIYEL